MLLKKLLVISLTLFFAVSNSASAQQDFAKSKVPLPFMENKGQIIDQHQQTNPAVLYQLALPGLNVSLKKDGFSYDTWMAEDLGEDQDLKDHRAMGDGPSPHKYNYKFHRIDVNFLGANPQCQIEALDRTPDYTMYYTTGTPEEGAKVHQYGKVLYRNLYHNIDLEFVAAPGTNKPVEYNFIVHPGADVAQIKMRYTGALDAQLKNGALLMQLAHTTLTENIPASWIAETKQAVQVNYKQLTQDQQSITIGFTANNINSNNTLIIDPTPNLDWGTYYGGSGEDRGYGIATDASGNVLVTGLTESSNAIATSGAHQTTYGGGFYDAFVVKFNPSGTRLWGTYYGGSGYDNGWGIATDASGNVLVTGLTQSSTAIATSGAHQETLGGGWDAFVVKFNPSGTRLWGTYYGGSGNDYGYGIATDASGNILVTGSTPSSTAIATSGAHQTTNGGTDAFVVKFNPSGSRLWGTYYGGSDNDIGTTIATDASGNILVTGYTSSSTAIATSGAHQTTYGGGFDAFVVKFNPSGSRLWGTYYGGSDEDWGYGIATDTSGNILVTGRTRSTNAIATSGAHQTTYGGGNRDAFVVKFNSSGTRLWGTYYGGSGEDLGLGIATDASGNILVTGKTGSSTAIATSGAHQTTYGGGEDAFVVKFNPSGTRLWGTYYGGSNGDLGEDIATDASGNVLVTGATASSTAIATSGAHQTTLGGSTDAFIARFSCPITSSSTNLAVCNNQLPYNWNGNSYNATGTYQATLTNSVGCDSIATLNLTVNQTTQSATNITICSNLLPYNWNGNSYNASGIYQATLTNSVGCDSIATLNLTVNLTTQSATNITICSNLLPYNWNGNNYNGAGTYNITLTNYLGCDSITTLNLLVINSTLSSSVSPTPATCGLPNGTLNGSASGGSGSYNYLWSNGATTASVSNLSAGTYTLTVTDNNGCTASSSATVNNSICPKVTTQSTVNNITQNTATVSWPAVSCAAKYRVVVKNVSTGTQTTTIVSAPNTSLNLSSLQANTTYQVRIRTQCSQNGTVVSQLSPITSFTTLNSQGIQCLPPANVSVSNITTTSAQINWTLLSGAIQYNLRYRKVGTSPWTTIVLNGTANTTTLQNLTASGSYEFQIRSKCNSNPDEFSPYSALNVFNTLAQRIEETEALSTLIYPNPTNTNINIVINAVSETQTTIRITDLLGRVLLNETEALIGGNNTITYNISDYAAGVYLVHVGNGNTQQVFKVVKE